MLSSNTLMAIVLGNGGGMPQDHYADGSRDPNFSLRDGGDLNCGSEGRSSGDELLPSYTLYY